MLYKFGIAACFAATIGGFGTEDYGVGIISLIAMWAFYMALTEKTSAQEVYEEAEMVYDTCTIMWEDEKLADKHAIRISEWIESNTYDQLLRYIKSFTQHDVEEIQGEDEGGLKWVIITFYPYDYEGIAIVIFLRSDMSYIITIVDNKDFIKSKLSLAVNKESPLPITHNDISPYALRLCLK